MNLNAVPTRRLPLIVMFKLICRAVFSTQWRAFQSGGCARCSASTANRRYTRYTYTTVTGSSVNPSEKFPYPGISHAPKSYHAKGIARGTPQLRRHLKVTGIFYCTLLLYI